MFFYEFIKLNLYPLFAHLLVTKAYKVVDFNFDIFFLIT